MNKNCLLQSLKTVLEQRFQQMMKQNPSSSQTTYFLKHSSAVLASIQVFFGYHDSTSQNLGLVLPSFKQRTAQRQTYANYSRSFRDISTTGNNYAHVMPEVKVAAAVNMNGLLKKDKKRSPQNGRNLIKKRLY